MSLRVPRLPAACPGLDPGSPRPFSLLLLLSSLLLFLLPTPTHAQPADTTYAARFTEVWTTVRDQFYDPAYNGADWTALRAEYAPRAAQATSMEDLAAVLNDLLAHLHTSHTHVYTPLDPAYHQLLDIFREGPLADEIRALYPDGIIRYPGIGIFTAEHDGARYVSGVPAGGPADRAGLRVGDRILAADGRPFHPIRSFEGRVGEAVRLAIQRTPDAAADTLTVVPEWIQPREFFLRALDESARLIERDGRRVGYVRLWSYAGEVYHEHLVDALAFGPLKDADALILDLRDGWGGANPTYLNVFNRNVPRITQISRTGEAFNFDLQWRKPVALLVNEGSRSGKEILAYGFKHFGLGPVVGTRTAGAVVGGRPFLLGGGLLLYLAVADARVEGERLEGVGVTPDVVVPFALPYANGYDPQLDAAVRTLLER